MWAAHNYCDIYPSRFTPGECARIIKWSETVPVAPSVMGNIRDSDLFWVFRGPDTNWAFERIEQLVQEYNQPYGLEIREHIDYGAQLTRYRPGQHYSWHMDVGPGPTSLRKVSVVVELSDPTAYQGGGLEVFYGTELNNRVYSNIGDVVMFQSYIMHRALPVTAGERWSLVLWMLGNHPLR